MRTGIFASTWRGWASTSSSVRRYAGRSKPRSRRSSRPIARPVSPLDHVNAHKHFHLHPTIGNAIIAIGKRYGMRALRIPIEPVSVLAKAEPTGSRWSSPTTPFAAMLGRRARRAGLRTPDAVFGLAWSGAMTPARLTGLLQHLPDGCSEIYTHPATRSDFQGHAPGYRYADELAALTAPSAVTAARSVVLGGYADFQSLI